MRILVTGATGFVGFHLCRQLANSGVRVTALRRATSNTQLIDGLDVETRTGDLTEPDSLSRAVQGHDAVVHAAADISYASTRERLTRINVEGTLAVARACREQGVGRLIHISSTSAIGIPPHGTVADERFQFNMFNMEHAGLHYHLSKKRAEEAVLREVELGLDAVIVNPATIFGPFGRGFRGAEMVLKARRSVIVPYFLGGICVVHVHDVVAGILAALKRGVTGERYILGGENVTYQDLARRGAAIQGLRRYFVPVGPAITGAAALLSETWGDLRNQRPRLSRTAHYCASRLQFHDSTKAQRVLGYRARPFDAILEECLEFANGRDITAAASGVANGVESSGVESSGVES